MQTPEPRQSPPRHCVSLAELVDRTGGRWIEPLHVGDSICYPLPEGLADETRAYLSRRAWVDTTSRGLAFFPEARVQGSGVVLSADGECLARDVAEDFGKAHDTHWLLGHTDLRPPRPLDGPAAVVAVNRGAGYCHWLLEELPRLLRLPRNAVPQVIAHAAGEPARAAWAYRGGRETLIEARRGTHLSVRSLWVPTLAARAGEPSPATVRELREFADGLGRGPEDSAGLGPRLYVSRAKASRRHVTNEAELWSALAECGFVHVALEDLPWHRQIAAMRAARVIVAPHGAGLANLVFCEPGTRVVELVNRAYFNPVFWRVAALVGLDYRVVFSLVQNPECEPLREDRSRNKDDLTADIREILAAVDGA